MCSLNIALLYQNILLFKCLSVSVLSAGVRGVRCTLCSIFQRNPGKRHGVLSLHTAPVMSHGGEAVTDAEYGHFSNHYAEKNGVNLHLELFFAAL